MLASNIYIVLVTTSAWGINCLLNAYQYILLTSFFPRIPVVLVHPFSGSCSPIVQAQVLLGKWKVGYHRVWALTEGGFYPLDLEQVRLLEGTQRANCRELESTWLAPALHLMSRLLAHRKARLLSTALNAREILRSVHGCLRHVWESVWVDILSC